MGLTEIAAMKKSIKYGLEYCRREFLRIKIFRGLTLGYSVLMAYYFNTLEVADSALISGYGMILSLSLVMWIYLDFKRAKVGLVMSNLLEEQRQAVKKNNKRRKKKKPL